MLASTRDRTVSMNRHHYRIVVLGDDLVVYNLHLNLLATIPIQMT